MALNARFERAASKRNAEVIGKTYDDALFSLAGFLIAWGIVILFGWYPYGQSFVLGCGVCASVGWAVGERCQW